MTERKIFGIGETILDVIFKNDQPMAAVPGGSVFNSLISLGRSVGKEFPDTPIQMITETGDDHIGDIIVNFMEENCVSTDCVTRNAGTQTHVSMAFLDEKNDAQYEFYKDHAHASLDSERFKKVVFHKNDILMLGSFFAINPILRCHTLSTFKKANAAGAVLYYDVNFRKPHIKELPQTIGNIIENFKLSTVVRGSTEDFLNLFGTSNPQEIYDTHLSQHCALFICTAGSQPLTVITPNFAKQYPVEQIRTISTIGAGDNFNAGFVYGLVKYNLTREDLLNADEAMWDRLIASGQAFSKKVCQSVFNYIPME